MSPAKHVAVIYARYSSDSQREASIDDQLRDCHAWADSHGYTVIEEYCDYAMTGRNDDRPAFQRMIADASKKVFDTVITYQTSRFARNRYDAAVYKYRLKALGVSVCYAKTSIPTGPEGIILEALMEGMDEYYSANLAINIRRSQDGNALKAMYLGGTMPFGLAIDADRHFIHDPLTAPHVLTAFQMIDDGAMQKDVIDYFNSIGLRTTKGKPFTRSSMSSLLTNRKYIGEYAFRDVCIPDAIPPIVPLDLFERVQQRLKQNQHVKGGHARSMVEFLLTGKLICGHCGGAMVGDSGTSRNGSTHYYYTCLCRKRGGGCTKKSERRRAIEVAVVEETVRHVLQPDTIAAVVDRVMEIYEKDLREDPVLASLLAEEKNVSTSLSNLMKAIEMGIFTPTTRDRMLELEAQKKDVGSRIRIHRASIPVIDRDRIKFFLNSFSNGNPNSSDYRRKVISTLVSSVTITDIPPSPDSDKPRRRLDLVYNLTDSNASSLTLSCSDAVRYAPRTELEIARFFVLSVLSRLLLAGSCGPPVEYCCILFFQELLWPRSFALRICPLPVWHPTSA